MKRWLAGLILGIYLAIGSVAWAEPNIPPAPSSSVFVQDYAGILSSDTRNKINSIGLSLQQKTKAHVLVVTIKSLEDNAISDYALAIMRQWGVGDKTLNNGVVILLSTGDRKSRIEVGYGLEGALPDGKVGRIQDDYMVPYFQKGDFDSGVLNGYLAVVGEVAKEYNVDIRADGKPAAHVRSSGNQSVWSHLPWWTHIAIIGLVIFLILVDWLFFGGMFTLLLLSLFRGGGGGGGGSGGGSFGGGSGGGGGSERDW